MFSNCRKYNQPETIYYKAADELEAFVEPLLSNIKENNNPPENKQS